MAYLCGVAKQEKFPKERELSFPPASTSKVLLVFEDKDGADAFSEWMNQTHSDLLHQALDDDCK